MKKVAVLTLVILLLITGGFIYRNSTTLKGTDELIEKAREVLPISQNEIASVSYAGIRCNDDDALVWFISEDGYGGHDYWVMNCKLVGRNTYKFVEWNRPKVYAKDIVSTLWNTDNIFLINDENCVVIQYTDDDGKVVYEDEIKEGSYPYLYDLRDFSGKVDFINSNGEYIFNH